MLFQVVPSVLLSMVALITTYMKESDWLLKNFHQSENGLQSFIFWTLCVLNSLGHTAQVSSKYYMIH